jgi:hypothetical protein
MGATVAMYSKSGVEQNEYILIGGIVVLMIGVYRISKNIPSNNPGNEDLKDKNHKDEF